jgi:hypothetical protein
MNGIPSFVEEEGTDSAGGWMRRRPPARVIAQNFRHFSLNATDLSRFSN